MGFLDAETKSCNSFWYRYYNVYYLTTSAFCFWPTLLKSLKKLHLHYKVWVYRTYSFTWCWLLYNFYIVLHNCRLFSNLYRKSSVMFISQISLLLDTSSAWCNILRCYEFASKINKDCLWTKRSSVRRLSKFIQIIIWFTFKSCGSYFMFSCGRYWMFF